MNEQNDSNGQGTNTNLQREDDGNGTNDRYYTRFSFLRKNGMLMPCTIDEEANIFKSSLSTSSSPSDVLPLLDGDEKKKKTSKSSIIFCCGGKELDWKDLNIIEEKRKRLLAYDSDNSGYRIIFTSFTGTVFKYIFLDPLFWITIAVFVAARLSCSYGKIEGCTFNIEISDTSISIMGAFLSFILTFFVNQARSDYNDAYSVAMNAKGE